VKRVVSFAPAAVPLLLALGSQFVHARERGQFAGANPEIKAWFDTLKSGKGPCCSDADGSAISDVDWESGHGHTACGSKAIGSMFPTKP
jgi:hypothetical protein